MGPYTGERTLLLGHRGASAHAPDNTLEAFVLALELGADGVELDVRRSADGILVLHHDAAPAETGPLIDLTFSEIRQRSRGIPTLDEAFEVLTDAVINIEIKNVPGEPDFDPHNELAHRLTRWIADHELFDSVIVSSFNPTSVAAVRRHDGRIATALLTHDIAPLEALAMAAAAGHGAIHPDVESMMAGRPDAIVAAARDAGMHVATWTVNDAVQARRLADAGLAAVITDDPVPLREAGV